MRNAKGYSLIHCVLKEEMALKNLFLVIMLMWTFDTCSSTSTKQGTNSSEQSPNEISCHRSLHQNGKLLTKESVSYNDAKFS